MLHIILKILGYVPLFQKDINLAVAKRISMSWTRVLLENFIRERGQLISQVIKADTITCYVKRQWKVFS